MVMISELFLKKSRLGHDQICIHNFILYEYTSEHNCVLRIFEINLLPSRIFLKATSTLVESNAEVSIKDNSFRSKKEQQINKIQHKMCHKKMQYLSDNKLSC